MLWPLTAFKKARNPKLVQNLSGRWPFVRADFWEGDATKHFSVEKKGFSVKRREAIQWIRGLVRISTGKAIQWRGSGHSLNRRSLKIEKLLSSSPSQKSPLISGSTLGYTNLSKIGPKNGTFVRELAVFGHCLTILGLRIRTRKIIVVTNFGQIWGSGPFWILEA